MTQVIVLDESEQRSAYPPLRHAFVLRRLKRLRSGL